MSFPVMFLVNRPTQSGLLLCEIVTRADAHPHPFLKREILKRGTPSALSFTQGREECMREGASRGIRGAVGEGRRGWETVSIETVLLDSYFIIVMWMKDEGILEQTRKGLSGSLY